MTQTLTFDLFVSIDGFAGSDGLPGYFGYFGPDLQDWIDKQAAEPHVALMGRRTYEVMASLPEEHRDQSWEAMTQRSTVVFSRTLSSVAWPGARIHSGGLAEEVERLKASHDALPLRTIGSLSVGRQLIAAGLVDRLRLVTFPVVAGAAGREPAFVDASSTEMELVESRVLDGRLQFTEYRPTGRDIPRGDEQRPPARSR